MINKKDYSVLAIENIKNICYINNHDTKEMLYMNSEAMRVFNISSEEHYKNKPCYKVIYGKDEECANCIAPILQPDKFISSILYIPKIDKHLHVTDSIKEEDGVKLHIVSALDASIFQELIRNLEVELQTESNIIKSFNTFASHISIHEALNTLLEIIAKYYKADRASFFEINSLDKTFSKKYEYNNIGINAEIYNYINLPLSEIRPNIIKYKENKKLFNSNKSDIKQINNKDIPFEDKYFFKDNIFKIMDTALVVNDEIIAFITIENPKMFSNRFDMLDAFAQVFLHHIQNFRMKNQIEYMEFVDPLTNVYNRKKFLELVKIYIDHPPSHIGVIYIHINEMQRINEVYGFERGDKNIITCANILKKYVDTYVYRTSGDEFICMLPDVNEEHFYTLVHKINTEFKEADDMHISLGMQWNKENVDIIKVISKSDELMNIEKLNYYENMIKNLKSKEE